MNNKKLTHPGIPSLKPKGRRLQNKRQPLTGILSPYQEKEATIKTTSKAFTLVELIVVITIVAILGMIAFISLQGYSADARDSSRISDVNHIKTSLELQSLASGKYPMPDNAQQVTLSGGTIVWHQGTVGENVTKILSRNLNEKPTDPLYNTEYIYSVTPSQNQYEVMSIYEGDMVYNNPPRPLGEGLGVRANASSNTVKIDGTYNGIYVKSNDYIIPTPSIITSLQLPLELNATTIKSQVINRGTNVPNIGTPKITQSTGALTFSNFEVYKGTLNQESSTGFLLAYQALANTYNGSSLADEGVIKTLLTQTTDEQKIDFTKSLILNTVSSSSLTYNCDETTKPTDNGHITYTTTPATNVNQAYIQDAPNCGFTCAVGYEYIEGSNACVESICNGSIPTYATSTATSQNTSTSWIYNTTPGVCTFTCNENYTWNGNSCIANTQTATCGGTLPTHAATTNGTTYIQTWDGSSWTPTGIEYIKDAGTCGYTCTDGYTGTNCEILPNPYTSCTAQGQIKYVIGGVVGTSSTGLTCSDDIIVCSGNGTGYTISACNVGATVAGTDRTNASTIGKHFQWGRNDGFAYNGGVTPTTTTTLYNGTSHVLGGIDLSGNATDSNKFIIASSTYSYNWLSKTGESIDPSWGQGPCVSGYHVPTQTEWSGIVTAGQWGTNGASMQTALKLPYAGNRYRNNGAFYDGGSYGFYWSSTPNGSYGYYLGFNSSGINPSGNNYRANGFSVRCFKN